MKYVEAIVPKEGKVAFQQNQFNNIVDEGEGTYLFPMEKIAKGKVRWGGYTYNSLRKLVEKVGGKVKILYIPEKGRDIVIWIGACFYPTIEDFIAEGKKLGSCRRIPKIPNDFIPGVGKSRVWLIHDDGFAPDKEKGQDKRKMDDIGAIFGFFYVNRIEAIIDDAEKKKELHKRVPIKYLKIADITGEPKRGCGYRRPGAYYLVGQRDFDKYFRIAKEFTKKFVLGGGDVILLKDPIPYIGRRFRGARYADEVQELLEMLMIEKLVEDKQELYK